ncbi:MAG: hypothetical protein RR139_11425, partial [Lachnospiraceae bacterium]
LEEAADNLKQATGYVGYIEELYFPIATPLTQGNHQELNIEKELLKKSLTKNQRQEQGRTTYHLAESYEVETILEEEVNRMVLENMYHHVYVAGKLEISTEVYQISQNQKQDTQEKLLKAKM